MSDRVMRVAGRCILVTLFVAPLPIAYALFSYFGPPRVADAWLWPEIMVALGSLSVAAKVWYWTR